MAQSIRIYSFADFDRSGKVRWTARELGLEIEESRLKYGEHLAEPFRSLNPLGQVPVVEVGGKILRDSTAICLVLAERHPESGLIPKEAGRREAFWQNLAIATTSLEQPVVNYALAERGVLDERWKELLQPALAKRLAAFAESMPESGWLHGEFTLADICAAYVLRIGVQVGLLGSRGRHGDYLKRLGERPAAIAARFFDSVRG